MQGSWIAESWTRAHPFLSLPFELFFFMCCWCIVPAAHDSMTELYWYHVAAATWLQSQPSFQNWKHVIIRKSTKKGFCLLLTGFGKKGTLQCRDELLHVVEAVVKHLKDPFGCSRQGLFIRFPSTSLKSLPYIYWLWLVDMKYCVSHGCVKKISMKYTTICPL